MDTLLGARSAAVCMARGRHVGFRKFKWSIVAAIALAMSGCMPATTAQLGTDPADPAARVARTGYSSSIAPYASLRPAVPAPWRERNDSVAPQPKPDR